MLQLTDKERKKIEEREKIFNESTREQQRVLVAKDVISRIKSDQLLAGHSFGTFEDATIEPELSTEQEVTKYHETQVRDVLGPEPKCSACGVGAVFVSSFLYADKLKIGDLEQGLRSIYFSDILEYLENTLDLFTYFQLKLIEIAYEKGEGCFEFHPDEEDENSYEYYEACTHAYYFGNKYTDDSDRLLAIMENIVENNGTFDP